MDNEKIYELILAKNEFTDKYEYSDFVRSANRIINEEKSEIRNNIANYSMDKQVEELVNDYLSASRVARYGDVIVVARVSWNEDEKKVELLKVAVANRVI